MKIELCSIWEGFDGSRFEVVDATKKSVVVRSVNDNRRIEVPAWKFTAGMLRNVEDGRKRLYAPSDVQIGKELWSLDYECEIKPESKSKRKNRYLCRITKPDTSISYKHLTPRKICALLNTEVDHIVDGDLRPGVEFKNGVRVVDVKNNRVRFVANDETYNVCPVSTFVRALNRVDKLFTMDELQFTMVFDCDGTPIYVGDTDSKFNTYYTLGTSPFVSMMKHNWFCAALNQLNREIRIDDLKKGVCLNEPTGSIVYVVRYVDSEKNVKVDAYSKKALLLDGAWCKAQDFVDRINGKISALEFNERKPEK